MLNIQTPKDEKIVCKECLEKYKNHENVLHGACYAMLYNEGFRDVRGPAEVPRSVRGI